MKDFQKLLKIFHWQLLFHWRLLKLWAYQIVPQLVCILPMKEFELPMKDVEL